MILAVKGHKGMHINDNNVNVVVIDSPIVYKEIISGFMGFTDDIKQISDTYTEIKLDEQYDYFGDPLQFKEVPGKYLTKIINSTNESIFPQDRDQILSIYRKLVDKIEDVLMNESIDFVLNPDYDIKKLLKFLGFKIDVDLWTNPYDIIETVFKIHQLCDLKTAIVFKNVSHYLENDQLHELIRLARKMQITLLLIEFKGERYFFEDEKCDCFYIDNDLVDWY